MTHIPNINEMIRRAETMNDYFATLDGREFLQNEDVR